MSPGRLPATKRAIVGAVGLTSGVELFGVDCAGDADDANG